MPTADNKTKQNQLPALRAMIAVFLKTQASLMNSEHLENDALCVQIMKSGEECSLGISRNIIHSILEAPEASLKID